MPVTLRAVLDRAGGDGPLAEASVELTAALVRTQPDGCNVAAVVPADAQIDAVSRRMPGLAALERTKLPRRELVAAWQMGLAPGAAGLIHAPTLVAPLVRHDRVHDHDQTVVTVWGLRPWRDPAALPKASVTTQRAFLRRARRHADAVVAPTHAHAEGLVEITPALAGRVRVIPGAAPAGFAPPRDAIGRRRALELPGQYLVAAAHDAAGLDTVFAAVARAGVDAPVVVLDAPDAAAPAIASRAVEAGLREYRVHVRGGLDAPDRAAVFEAAVAHLDAAGPHAFPWRTVEALTIGTPVAAVGTPVHRELIVDGGVLVDAGPDALAAGLAELLASEVDRRRYAVRAADRGRAFSWDGAAERVWHLHAEI